MPAKETPIDEEARPPVSATGGSERFHRVTRRYAPVFLVLMVQALLVAIAPSTGRGPANDGFAVSSGGAGSRVGGVSAPVTGEGSSAVSGGPGATGRSGGGGTGGPGAGAAGETQAVPTVGIDPNESGLWPWTHSWNLEGDRSKCAEGGQIQETVTVVPIPCVPKFEGDNLGATWDGVTAETITVVIYRGASNPAGDAILAQQELATSYENEKQAVAVYGEFFNKHYEFYGRKIQWIDYQGLCDGTDASCWRTDVRNMVKQFKPFLVVHDKSVFPEFHDELARLGVPNIGGWHFDPSFRTARRPYTFDLFGDGEISARHTATYWCRKLAGKTAAEAGDPLIRNQTRKMGIVTEDLDVYRLAAEKLTGLVSGGLCGDEPPPVFTYNFDIARGQEQMVAIVAGLKDEDVTTVVCLCEPVMPVFLY